MGGEKMNENMVYGGRQGSPPRGRGKAKRQAGLLFPAGITPAQAGKSIPAGAPLYAPWDHPRVGGEKAVALFRTSKASGSPPRERGKGKARNAVTHQLRITPAWAGKSYRFPVGLPPTWDHPRVGGEKSGKRWCFSCLLGSPPRRRGKA